MVENYARIPALLNSLYNLFLVLHTIMPCLVAIADYIHADLIVHYANPIHHLILWTVCMDTANKRDTMPDGCVRP